MAKTPGVTAIAIVALALGIGANTAMFSIVSASPEAAAICRPRPPHSAGHQHAAFRDASVSIRISWTGSNRATPSISMAAYRFENFTLTGDATPERLRGQMMSAAMFGTLGVRPILGRAFSIDEDRRGGAPVVVLTSNFWQTRFGGDPHVLGRSLTLNHRLYTVIGVVPSDDVLWRIHRSSCRSANGRSRCSGTAASVWGCAWSDGCRRDPELAGGPGGARRHRVGVGQSGSNREQGPRHLRRVARGEPHRDVRTPLLLLLGAVGFVLVMACGRTSPISCWRAPRDGAASSRFGRRSVPRAAGLYDNCSRNVCYSPPPAACSGCSSQRRSTDRRRENREPAAARRTYPARRLGSRFHCGGCARRQRLLRSRAGAARGAAGPHRCAQRGRSR